MKIHLRIDITGPALYACGVGNRWASQQISSVRNPEKVTCHNCVRTDALMTLAYAIKK